MILSSSIIQYLFYIFLICITNLNVIATINKTNSLTTKKISSTTIIDQSTSTPDIDSDENDESDETLISSNIIDATSRIKNKLPLVLVTNANRNRITSTKSSLPIILGSIFGGLTGIVLIAGIITYLLIKQGYIKVFNQPRTRIVDSSSITVDANPSQR